MPSPLSQKEPVSAFDVGPNVRLPWVVDLPRRVPQLNSDSVLLPAKEPSLGLVVAEIVRLVDS